MLGTGLWSMSNRLSDVSPENVPGLSNVRQLKLRDNIRKFTSPLKDPFCTSLRWLYERRNSLRSVRLLNESAFNTVMLLWLRSSIVVLDGMLDGTSVKSIPDAIQVVPDTCGSKVITIAITVDDIIISATTEKLKF